MSTEKKQRTCMKEFLKIRNAITHEATGIPVYLKKVMRQV